MTTQETYQLVLETVSEMRISGMRIRADVDKVTDVAKIAEYPLRYTPGVVINEELVYYTTGEHQTIKGVTLEAPTKAFLREVIRKYA